jgi:flagellar biosynthesis protein FlgN
MDQTSLLLQRVNDEVQIVNKLLDTLEREEGLLVSDSVDLLIELSQTKSQVVGDFALASQARYAQLKSMGYEPEDSSMQLLIEQTHPTQLMQAWAHFLTRVTLAKEKNRINGILLQKLSFRNQSALDVIQGRKTGNLYGPNGQKNTHSNFRTTVS